MFKDKYVNQIVKILKQSQNILFITGAGLSADSGLPTYRGIGGLYSSTGTVEEGMSIEQALSGHTLINKPEISWKYIYKLEKTCRGSKYNISHEVIAKMEQHFERVWVLTQNVDGFHKQAGSKNVIDIHGDIHNIKCIKCSYYNIVQDYSKLVLPPECPDCKGLIRPDVVLFGEMLPTDKVHLLTEQVKQGFDAVFSIGTTSLFPYISEPIMQAKRMGIPTIEINPGSTAVTDYVDIKISKGAAKMLDIIWKEYKNNS